MAMRDNDCTEKEEKNQKLCSGFSLLDERDQENMFGTLCALLFAKFSIEAISDTSLQSKNEHFG
jgi:hypothetical protein